MRPDSAYGPLISAILRQLLRQAGWRAGYGEQRGTARETPRRGHNARVGTCLRYNRQLAKIMPRNILDAAGQHAAVT